MAASSLAISSASLTTHVNATANAAADVNANVTVITNAFNAALETATGHYHDGTDSRVMYGGLTGLTANEFAFYLLMRSTGGRI